jgi:putative RNA 2'-phosphotransferase
MNLDKISRTLSKLLRHDPTPLKLNSDGWMCVDSILNHFNITLIDLKNIVETNDKKRFSFNDDETLICANQGHSSNVAINKKLSQITSIQKTFLLYHGTDQKAHDLIILSSLRAGNRQHVHWTTNLELAQFRANQKAIKNKSTGVIITMDVKNYLSNKGKLYLSDNNVYLTPDVENQFLNK